MIRKAIIPAAGLGTRFLPATKALPKEMLPIIDTPTIQYIVEEAVASGIEEILIITGKGKRAIEDHFDYAKELESRLAASGKTELLKKIQATNDISIHYIRQKEPLGLGDAVLCAKQFVGDQPFAVLLGDDVISNPTGMPALQQLIGMSGFLQGASVIGVQQVAPEEIPRYGIVKPGRKYGKLVPLDGLVEKPAIEDAPSNLAVMGRYILTPAIFGLLETQEAGAGGEIQLTDAIHRLAQQEFVHSFEFDGTRYDVGDQLGYVKTTIDFAVMRNDLKDDVLEYMFHTLRNKGWI